VNRGAILFAPIVLLAGGCLSTAASIVTAPVRAVGQVADWTTTSQSEADRNRGRRLRERDEEVGRLNRRFERDQRRCLRGNDNRACRDAARWRQEIDNLEAMPD
jgi:hypothetical protein